MWNPLSLSLTKLTKKANKGILWNISMMCVTFLVYTTPLLGFTEKLYVSTEHNICLFQVQDLINLHIYQLELTRTADVFKCFFLF